MKTLDEVIDDLKMRSRLVICTRPKDDYWVVPIETIQDALHYLIDFRYAKDVLELEKDRYAEAVKNCEAAELKYRQLSGELGINLAELRNEDQLYPNILFRPDGMYCCVCGSRLDQDREEDQDPGFRIQDSES